MTAPEFAVKLRASSVSERSMPNKELAVEEDSLSRRGPEKKGNPRKLPKALRQRGRQLKRF